MVIATTTSQCMALLQCDGLLMIMRSSRCNGAIYHTL